MRPAQRDAISNKRLLYVFSSSGLAAEIGALF